MCDPACGSNREPASVNSTPLRLRVKKLHPKLIFQFSHLAAEGGLGDIQQRRGAVEAAGARDGEKIAKFANIHDDVPRPMLRDRRLKADTVGSFSFAVRYTT